MRSRAASGAMTFCGFGGGLSFAAIARGTTKPAANADTVNPSAPRRVTEPRWVFRHTSHIFCSSSRRSSFRYRLAMIMAAPCEVNSVADRSGFRARKKNGATPKLSGLTVRRGGAGEALRLLSGAKQRHCFIDAFLLLELRLGVGDYAGAGLDMHDAVLEQRRAQCDAGVHLFAGREIADAAGIERALFLFQFVDDLHRTHLWRAGDGAGWKTRDQCVECAALRAQSTFDV